MLTAALDAMTGDVGAFGVGSSDAPDAAFDALREACVGLQRPVEPAALRLLGSAAGRAWLLPLWRALARRAQALPWRPDRGGTGHDHDHAAPLWSRAADWQAATAAVAGIESWRRVRRRSPG